MSSDALAAALLGALVEIDGCAPHFRRDGERPRDALRRLRPAVALVDIEYPGACSAAFMGPAKMMRVRVVLFGRPRLGAVVDACAEEFEVRALHLPPAPGALGPLLHGDDA